MFEFIFNVNWDLSILSLCLSHFISPSLFSPSSSLCLEVWKRGSMSFRKPFSRGTGFVHFLRSCLKGKKSVNVTAKIFRK